MPANVVIWLEPNETLIPVDLIAGAIAEAIHPYPERIEKDGDLMANDPNAFERLTKERSHAQHVRLTFGENPEPLSFGQVSDYLAKQHRMTLEVRHFDCLVSEETAQRLTQSGVVGNRHYGANVLALSDSAVDLDTTGMVSWQAAILERIDSVTERNGSKTTARQVLLWCRNNGPRDVFPKEQPDERNSFTWIDTEGNQHTNQLGTVDNVWSAWRTAGKIPAKR